MPGVREFLLPDVGEGLTEAEVVRWHVAPGDSVAVNQPVAEIETAKAVVELPSPYAGVVVELLVDPGVLCRVGTPILAVEVSDVDAPPADEGSGSFLVGYGVAAQGPSRRRRRPPSTTGAPAAAGVISVATPPSSRVRAKPPVRLLAKRLGINLAAVTASGPGGIVTRDDVQRGAGGGTSTGAVPTPPMPGDVRVPATAVQRAMASAMVRSATTIPQATAWLEVDVTESLVALERMRADGRFAGARVSPLTLVAAALVATAADHPTINASWDASTDEVVLRAEVNLGVAVASARGLVVPVIRSAQGLELPDLARALTALTDTARDGRATPADMTGGTITITNIGVLGVDGGIPLVNPPEAAILAVGQVAQRPWVVDGDVVARPVMQLSLSFDHRLVDGALGASVLAAVAERLRGDVRV